jgi:subtilase family serine protease
MRCTAWVRTDIARSNASGPSGYSPANLQSAYSLTGPSGSNGTGQTVAIVDAYDDPHAESDLAFYRSTFALSACTTANGCFVKVNEAGATSPLPATDPSGGWEGEESLDLDMVSAICPNCNIVLVEANSNNSNDLYSAEDTAAATCGANVISNSWVGGEYSSETLDETHFNHPGVMITVSAGDNGYGPANTGYPAVSQYVTSVGGTSLHVNSGIWSQTVWSGTGSLCSQYIAQPSWQASLGISYTGVCGKRIANDVAAIADPNTGVAVYDTFGGSCSAWCVFGGTSASAPIVGAVYALAGNESTITYASYAYSHTGSLTDITSGSNGSCGGTFLCTAGAGYDGPTGNGTPLGIGAF